MVFAIGHKKLLKKQNKTSLIKKESAFPIKKRSVIKTDCSFFYLYNLGAINQLNDEIKYKMV